MCTFIFTAYLLLEIFSFLLQFHVFVTQYHVSVTAVLKIVHRSNNFWPYSGLFPWIESPRV